MELIADFGIGWFTDLRIAGGKINLYGESISIKTTK